MSRHLLTLLVSFGALNLGLNVGCKTDPKAAPNAASSGGGGGETSSGGSENSSGGAKESPGGQSATGGASAEIVDACPEPTGEGTDVPSTITEDTEWDYRGSPYRISSTTYLTATLGIGPCTVIELDGDAGILVGNDPEEGRIVGHGTLTWNDDGQRERRGITFRRLNEDEPWGSIAVDPTGELDLLHVSFEGGGSLNSAQNGGGTIVAYGGDPEGDPNPSLRLRKVTISDSETYGINLQSQAAFADDSDAVTVQGSGVESGYPIYLEAGVAFSLPTNLSLIDNERDEVVIHPFSRMAEDTLPARGVPLVFDSQLYVATPNDDPGTATLTIEAGVEVQFDEGAGSGIIFGADDEHPGTLVAIGEEDDPIWLHAADPNPDPGAWMGLYFAYTTVDVNHLTHTIIEDAGAQSGAQGYGCGPIENNASVLIMTDEAIDPFIQQCEFKNAGGDTQILLGWDSDDQTGEAEAFVEGNTFADAPECRVSLPRAAEAPACPGNDSEPDCL
jgi:hypothetical protein